MSAAPDYLAPVVGWRTWCVDDSGAEARLRSVVRPGEWPVGEAMTAGCSWGSISHQPPGIGCRCGIHAARDAAEAAFHAELPSRAHEPVAVGLVALWGRVVEGDAGWRAASAYPSVLYVPARSAGERERSARIAWDLTAYGVPAGVLDCTTRGVAEALWAVTPAARAALPRPLPLAA